MTNSTTQLKTVEADFGNNILRILDQTRLPEQETYLDLRTPEEIWEAIYRLRVRGAPALGVAAALGIAVCAARIEAKDFPAFRRKFKVIKDYLATSRPTAVNLFTALDRMEACLQRLASPPIGTARAELRAEALKIQAEDITACRKIGEYGLQLLRPGMGLLTHCNAGRLAVSGCGTALAPVYLGHERGYRFSVFADETRPLLQGARLTAFELQKAGIDVTLICDNMASAVMKQKKIQAVLVGCDQIAANGDTANKIGTSGVAVLAHHYRIPFYVLGPTSTIDFGCPDGTAIRIEERPAEEITEHGYSHRMAPENIKTYNPAFDITGHELITAIITEKGIAYPPFTHSLRFPAPGE